MRPLSGVMILAAGLLCPPLSFAAGTTTPPRYPTPRTTPTPRTSPTIPPPTPTVRPNPTTAPPQATGQARRFRILIYVWDAGNRIWVRQITRIATCRADSSIVVTSQPCMVAVASRKIDPVGPLGSDAWRAEVWAGPELAQYLGTFEMTGGPLCHLLTDEHCDTQPE